jgi:hypothetical protein
MAGLTLLASSLFATLYATAQTVISNETLATTTLVVNKQGVTTKCSKPGCFAERAMFAAIPVTCPAATGQTCTFHISLDAKMSLVSTATSFYQFLIDGAAPTVGPTDAHGVYVFQENTVTFQGLPLRQSYPASVVTSVTNSSSNSHAIMLDLGCADTTKTGGCETTANWSTMRVDVFEP